MKLPINGVHPKRARRGSFSFWDLIAIVVILAVVGVWFVFEHTGERGRVTRCAGNLKQLGKATQLFASDHDDGLPAAAINTGKQIISWDTALVPYLDPETSKGKSVYEKTRRRNQMPSYCFCPSDPVKRRNPRSYAMSGRPFMYGWPPTSQDETGLGMWWDKQTITAFLDQDLARKAMEDPDLLPHVKRSVLSDPANTLLFTELITPNNMLSLNRDSVVVDIYQQEKGFNGDSSHFHFGKFNYVMADGHVELLFGKQTDGRGPNHNIWTIDAGD